MRINLLLAAAALAFWSYGAPAPAAIALWVGAFWLLLTATLMDFNLRRSRDLSWQLLTILLLLYLIAAAPERHGILVWVWAAFFLLPQSRMMLTFNVLGAAVSWVLVALATPMAQALMLLLALGVLSLLAYAQSRKLVDVHGSSVRQRLRLIPGLNLWPAEQLLRDLNREQIRAKRENIHAEVMIVHVKRHQLWSCAQRLCNLTHAFESVYRLDGSSLAVLLLCTDPHDMNERRQRLCSALPGDTRCQYVALSELGSEPITIKSLTRQSVAIDAPRECCS
ncbi:hypothetical protein RN347_09835 [Halomonas sp. PAMB 3264]|uniref:hypothetical protein n=1 Tax=Halomonas sp. PAMB 3264 TaxID=3075222 RepID=UPI002899E70A|nr:hypothetical protein [Halomonas sp. PAMB 3264]WNL40935.1 hypothetical protein RN347_09835 [Halomonas sp. PAMB 3264]